MTKKDFDKLHAWLLLQTNPSTNPTNCINIVFCQNFIDGSKMATSGKKNQFFLSEAPWYKDEVRQKLNI